MAFLGGGVEGVVEVGWCGILRRRLRATEDKAPMSGLACFPLWHSVALGCACVLGVCVVICYGVSPSRLMASLIQSRARLEPSV